MWASPTSLAMSAKQPSSPGKAARSRYVHISSICIHCVSYLLIHASAPSLWFSYRHVTGHPSTEYVSDETPMVSYMNLHLAFEQMRVKALRRVRNSPSLDGGEGHPDGPPRVLILGPEHAGKTSACKILTNYAVRAGQDWAPMYVNVDPSEVSLSITHFTIREL